MKITRKQLRRIIREEKARLQEQVPPGQQSRAEGDAMILADQLEYAVFDGLEELGVTAEEADEIIRHLYNRPEVLKEALTNGLYDYKRKLGMTGMPKPRQV